MNQVYAVKVFQDPRVGYYHYPEGALTKGQGCVVETEHGLDFGEIVASTTPACLKERLKNLRNIVRPMNPRDWEIWKQKQIKEAQAWDYCQERAQAHRLMMKLVRVRYSYDFKKATFYYTAQGRIDFRQLVKELAKKFRIRVEMRQIGVRDEAKMMPGCGSCGKPLCCSYHLREFAPVSMKMAKSLNLVLNPSKLSGVCGRLKCCLAYEYEEMEV